MENMENADSKKFVHYAGALFLAVATVVLVIGLFQSSWFKNLRAEVTVQPYARTVTVSADGKINATPDIAKITLAVVGQGKTVKEVTAAGNQKMAQVIDAVSKLGVEKKDITTTQYSLTPQYPPYDSNRLYTDKAPEIIGYSLNQEISVKVRNLQVVDDVLDSSTKAGANEVGQLTFDIDDASPYKKDARDKAFKTAREKAEEMAQDAGVHLGRVITFSENVSDYPVPYANFAMSKTSDAVAAPSVEPGSKELSVSVSVTYEIE